MTTPEAHRLFLHTDGAARGNPGPAAVGVVVKDERGETLREFGRRIGRTTNNQAEYLALLAGLEEAARQGADEVVARVDSELLARQLSGQYRVKSPDLLPLYQRVVQWCARFRSLVVEHVPRERNRRADELANAALDAGPTPTRPAGR